MTSAGVNLSCHHVQPGLISLLTTCFCYIAPVSFLGTPPEFISFGTSPEVGQSGLLPFLFYSSTRAKFDWFGTICFSGVSRDYVTWSSTKCRFFMLLLVLFRYVTFHTVTLLFSCSFYELYITFLKTFFIVILVYLICTNLIINFVLEF